MSWVTNPGNESERRVGRLCGWKAFDSSVRRYVTTPMCDTRRLPRTLGQPQNKISPSTGDSIFQGLGRQFHPWHPKRDSPSKKCINEIHTSRKIYFTALSVTYCKHVAQQFLSAFICNPGCWQALVVPRSTNGYPKSWTGLYEVDGLIPAFSENTTNRQVV